MGLDIPALFSQTLELHAYLEIESVALSANVVTISVDLTSSIQIELNTGIVSHYEFHIP